MIARSLAATLCVSLPALLAAPAGVAAADSIVILAGDDGEAGLFNAGEPGFINGISNINVDGSSTAVTEFSLPLLPSGAVITAATFQVNVASATSANQGETPPLAQAFFRPGNGVAGLDDTAGGGFFESGEVSVAVGLLSVSLSAADLQAILATDAPYLTVNLRRPLTADPATSFSISAREASPTASLMPRLVITYEIPEPAVAALVGLGGVALLRRRHA